MTSIQIEVSVAALLLLIFIFLSLRKNTMSIKISIAWLLLPIVFIIIAIFPTPLTDFAHWLGFETLSNFIFVIIIALLLILCFSLTTTVSRQGTQITKLTQEISLLKHKHKQSRRQNEKSRK